MASYHMKGLDHFWRNKLVTVYIPYFIVEVIASVLARRTLVDTLLVLTFLQTRNALMWYMQYLVCCYFLFWLAYRFITDKRICYIIWGVAAILSFIFLDNLRGKQAIAFLGGLIYSDYERLHVLNNTAENGAGAKQKRKCILGFLLAVFALLALAVKQIPVVREQSHYVVTLLNLIIKSGGAPALLLITAQIQPFKRLLSWVGKFSYSLYLIHGYFLYFLAEDVFGSYLLNSVVLLAISYVLAVVLNWVTGLIKSRIRKSQNNV